MTHLITGNKFDPNEDIPDLSGKVFIVTGGNAGIGFGITAHLLQHGPAKIYMLGKKDEHGDEAMKELENYGDVSKVEWRKCELENLKQVDEVAKELAKLERLDGLICNAGLGVGKYGETVDGIDSHMQVNHISHVHLAMTLFTLLTRTPNSRLVVQASDLHRGAPSSTAFASLEELNTDIGPTNLYNRTKLAQILFVKALVRRMQKGQVGSGGAEGPWINAVHPGAVSTDQQKQAIDAYGIVGKIGVEMLRPFMKDPVAQGCRPALFAATGADVVTERIQGQYIIPDRKVSSPSKQAEDVELGERLWKLTEQILTQKLGQQPYMTETQMTR